jgi:nucleotide-binding universal stress UspA family protein
MFSRILVPTDLSAASRQALALAVKLAAAYGDGRIHLLHVIETIADASFEEFEAFYLRLEHHAHEALQQMIADCAPGAIPVEPRLLYGNRAREIVRCAGECAVDLIVMASHKVDLQDPASGWGTISYKVGIFAQCPVLLVK